jgi:hypothetical protein
LEHWLRPEYSFRRYLLALSAQVPGSAPWLVHCGSLSKVLAVHSKLSVLVCGDDLTDEDMFKELSAQGARTAGCCESILVCPPLEEGGDAGTVRATAATCFVSSASEGASPRRARASHPPSRRALARLSRSLPRTHTHCPRTLQPAELALLLEGCAQARVRAGSAGAGGKPR